MGPEELPIVATAAHQLCPNVRLHKVDRGAGGGEVVELKGFHCGMCLFQIDSNYNPIPPPSIQADRDIRSINQHEGSVNLEMTSFKINIDI